MQADDEKKSNEEEVPTKETKENPVKKKSEGAQS